MSLLERVLTDLGAAAEMGPGQGGTRDILAVESVHALVRNEAVREVVESELGPGAFACRGILFNKTPSSNWKVVWHQDVTIAVRSRIEKEGLGPWSRKAGTPHVQPPAEVLEGMLAVRIHVDDCGPTNGPLQVLAGSHRHGKLATDQIDSWIQRVEPTDCLADAGSLLALKPLLLHRSSKAVHPTNRRVIHIEFANRDLPGGLEWKDRVPMGC